jgi:hypothetical protein
LFFRLADLYPCFCELLAGELLYHPEAVAVERAYLFIAVDLDEHGLTRVIAVKVTARISGRSGVRRHDPRRLPRSCRRALAKFDWLRRGVFPFRRKNSSRPAVVLSEVFRRCMIELAIEVVINRVWTLATCRPMGAIHRPAELSEV